MDNFKQASKEKLRILTNKGSLSVEQLWDLSLADLDGLAVALQTEFEQSGKKSFLVAKSAKDKTAKLRFDVVLDVLLTKNEDAETAKAAAENKERKQKIMGIIEKKKDQHLEDMPLKDLEKMLKD